jgi:short-subunit dehydrogenase
MDSLDFRARYGPWALVAGASQGLGTEFARQLSAAGLNTVLVARNADKLSALAAQLMAEHHTQVRTVVADLAQGDSLILLAQQTRDIDIGLLVYNAAHSVIGPFLTCSPDDHLREIDTNVRAPMLLAHHFGQHLVARRRGGIILMSSLSSMQGSALIANYGATKAYNQILAEGLWDELREHGVDVLACCAGAVQTPGYIESLQHESGHGSRLAPAIAPAAVVRDALAALGHHPTVVPGRTNHLLSIIMQHALPRRVAIGIMGRTLRRMYASRMQA